MQESKASSAQPETSEALPFLKLPLTEKGKKTMLFLDWLIGAVERLTVLGVVYVVFSVGRHALWGDPYSRKWAENILNILSEKWKGLILLLIPLFYRSVRAFLERVEKFAGMEAPREKRSPESEKGE